MSYSSPHETTPRRIYEFQRRQASEEDTGAWLGWLLLSGVALFSFASGYIVGGW